MTYLPEYRPQLSAEGIARTYDSHPLTAERILERAQHYTGQLTEGDLAEDALTQITDQNHIGGSAFVQALADLADINSVTRVLDLGCGIAGSARYIAWKKGCRVDGIELNVQRCKDANQLTNAVGLSHLVTVMPGDITQCPVALNRYDVIWGQGSWAHVAEPNELLQRWCSGLRINGRYSFEDVFLKRVPTTSTEHSTLQKLVGIWNCYLHSKEKWLEILRDLQFRTRFYDLSSELEHYCLTMLTASRRVQDYPSVEFDGYRYGQQLSSSGILGYFRIIAERQ